ncbi:cellulase family glycosylhydrolase [Fulvivirga maritima]|uniref:cellulase family glycosylhydrolase n=1 Tax=Fulvivirga maritima TaxID=2904247 RepID=UPI001F3C6C8B|nr:cellulase family glycosylhydrolase [Fulvivirga maritima]UII25637.1 cellulase family glycosylhydrolase [Fulvivirga maritima]
MKNYYTLYQELVGKICYTLLIILLAGIMPAYAQLPTANQVADEMTIGWNLGNSLEVPGGETGWGNPPATQQFINQIKAAGFNTLRLPCAWDSHANQSTLQIDAAWLARVKEVVDYGLSNDMYVIINSHWDGGWLEEHPFYSHQQAVNQKQDAYWTQIANYFASYDEHLLFAGTNEVRADYGAPTSEYIEVQESYNQTFVDAVRATGGNNSSRTLIVQTYNTNIWNGLDYFTLPTDPATDRLIVEVHHYDPYDFTLNPDNNAACTVWGQPWAGGDVCNWGQEAYTDDLFGRVKQEWVDNDVPVIIGEFCVSKRLSLSGTALTDHLASREYYLEYISNSASTRGIIPIYWDNGHNGDTGSGIFDRYSGNVTDQGAIDALMAGVSGGTPPPPGSYSISTSTIGSGTITLSPAGGNYTAGTSVTITANPATGWSFDNWSGGLSGSTNPTSVTVNANMNITANFSENQTGTPCSSPTPISTPFSQNGAGSYCWTTSGPISYINSWGLESLTINGVDYTNQWSNALPAQVNGQWVIQYEGSLGWSHFEASSPNSARVGNTEIAKDKEGLKLFPNPFKNVILVKFSDKDQVQRVVLRDLNGKSISTYTVDNSNQLSFGQYLKPGTYLIEVQTNNTRHTYQIVKSE